MKRGAVLFLIAGLALAIFLIARVGIGPVFGAAERVGWGGFALICLTGLSLTVILAAAWYALVPGAIRWPSLLAARQLRDSAGDVLPFTHVGGVVLGARAAILGGLRPPLAFASIVVDVTTELMAQIAFTVLGLAIGIAQLRASEAFAPYVDGLIIGTALLIPGAAAFILLQKRGGGLAAKIAERFTPSAVSHTEAFSTALNAIYDRPWNLVFASTLHLLAWIASGIWLWYMMRLAGARIDVLSAVAIEALLAALRSAAVFVPSAVGIQEAGYAALAPVFGVPAEIGLAVSLLRRARDIAIGVPVLLLWQVVEGRRALVTQDGNEP